MPSPRIWGARRMPKPKPKTPAAATPAPADQRPTSARKELYDEVFLTFDGIQRDYEQAHPERVGDARWDDAMTCSITGVTALLALLEGVDIEPLGTVERLRREYDE